MELGRVFEGEKTDWRWIQAASLLFFITVVLGIMVGPKGIFWSSGAGVAVSLLSLLMAAVRPGRFPRPFAGGILLLCHLVALIIGWALSLLFLRPIPEHALRLPTIARPYTDPGGLFALKGPVEWRYIPDLSPTQAGVKVRPAGRDQYMGASEIQIWVRPLETEPKSVPDFIEKMARSLSQSGRPRDQGKLFEVAFESASLLDGSKGVFSVLDVKRFWIEMRQVTLFGVKDRRFLCSVSVTGLRKDSILSKVMCLGLFETIKISS